MSLSLSSEQNQGKP